MNRNGKELVLTKICIRYSDFSQNCQFLSNFIKSLSIIKKLLISMLKTSLTIFLISLLLSNDVVNKDGIDDRRDNKKKNLSFFSILQRPMKLNYLIFGAINVFNLL